MHTCCCHMAVWGQTPPVMIGCEGRQRSCCAGNAQRSHKGDHCRSQQLQAQGQPLGGSDPCNSVNHHQPWESLPHEACVRGCARLQWAKPALCSDVHNAR